jgi:hypothetical protein
MIAELATIGILLLIIGSTYFKFSNIVEMYNDIREYFERLMSRVSPMFVYTVLLMGIVLILAFFVSIMG